VGQEEIFAIVEGSYVGKTRPVAGGESLSAVASRQGRDHRRSLSWAYTNGSLFAGQAENFEVYEYGTDGTLDNVLANTLAIGNGQPTADPVYSDSLAGSQAYFQVITDDANWELVVVSCTG
jgi:hypothetical protein